VDVIRRLHYVPAHQIGSGTGTYEATFLLRGLFSRLDPPESWLRNSKHRVGGSRRENRPRSRNVASYVPRPRRLVSGDIVTAPDHIHAADDLAAALAAAISRIYFARPGNGGGQ